MSEYSSDISLRFCKIQLNIEIMKSKLILLLLSIAVSAVFGTPSNAKPSIEPKIAQNPSTTTKIPRPRPISLWKFASPGEDLGGLLTTRSISDWNRIAIVSKPYRSGTANGVKPFAQWGLENIQRDLGGSYTPSQAADWNQLAVVTKPYR
jgi:hypothetical protein